MFYKLPPIRVYFLLRRLRVNLEITNDGSIDLTDPRRAYDAELESILTYITCILYPVLHPGC